MTSDTLSNALGSAAASIISRCCTHPLDTFKARRQATSGSEVKKFQGFRSYYQGLGTVIIGGTPATVLYLCSYDIFKEYLQTNFDNIGNESFVVHFFSGIMAETVACTIYVPVDVVKERLQTQVKGGHFYYRSSWDALVAISSQEGLVGLYKGFGATLASFGPFSALYFVFYERFKQYSKYHLQSDILPLPWIIASSASAGGLASFLTSPLDMAKLRLQIQRGKTGSSPTTKSSSYLYTGVRDCLRHAYNQGGIQALFRGAGARVAHFMPATAVTMTCYESFRSFFYNTIYHS